MAEGRNRLVRLGARLLYVVLGAALASGCTTMRPVPSTPGGYQESIRPGDRLRVVMRDGRVLEVTVTAMTNEALVGKLTRAPILTNRHVTLPLADVTWVEREDAGLAATAAAAGASGGPETISQGPSPPAAPGPAATVAGAEPAAAAQAPDGAVGPWPRGKTYVTAWLGWGGGTIDRRGGSTGFAPILALPVPQSAGVAFGVPAGRRLLLGGEWNVTFGVNCVASMNGASGACDRAVVLQHLLATATFFPLWKGAPEVAPLGLLVRGAAGLALLNSWPEDIASTGSPAAAEPAGPRWRRTGAGVLAGVGYALGDRRTPRRFDVGLDLAWQWYGRSASEPDRSFAWIFHAGLVFH